MCVYCHDLDRSHAINDETKKKKMSPLLLGGRRPSPAMSPPLHGREPLRGARPHLLHGHAPPCTRTTPRQSPAPSCAATYATQSCASAYVSTTPRRSSAFACDATPLHGREPPHLLPGHALACTSPLLGSRRLQPALLPTLHDRVLRRTSAPHLLGGRVLRRTLPPFLLGCRGLRHASPYLFFVLLFFF